MPSEDARVPEHTAMDVIDRLLRAISDSDDDLDRLAVVAQHKNGSEYRVYSNARSEAELSGMFSTGIDSRKLMIDDEEVR